MIGSAAKKELSGAEKVGLLLLALGKDRAEALLKKFDSEELNIIMRSTEVMPALSTEELEGIVEELGERLGKGAPFTGRPEDLKRLVNSAIVRNRSSSEEGKQEGEREDVWGKLPGVADDSLFNFISRLHPQLTTYLLYRLGPERATSIIKLFPPDQRNELFSRTLSLRLVMPPVVEALEEALNQEFFAVNTGSSEKHIALASILSNLEKADTTQSLSYLAATRPRDAEAIRKMIFKFTDLTRLSQKSLTVLMDGVPVERVVIALNSLPPSFQQKVISALSPRARRMAEAELQSSAVVQPKDVAEARRAIVDSVLKLIADGSIVLESEVMIEAPTE